MATWDDLRNGLKLYTEQEPDEALYLEPAAYNEAIKLANTMEAFNLPVPRIFCHGGDCAVFIWGEMANAGGKHLQMYINITDEGPGKLRIRNYDSTSG